jgi:hypothetical protein
VNVRGGKRRREEEKIHDKKHKTQVIITLNGRWMWLAGWMGGWMDGWVVKKDNNKRWVYETNDGCEIHIQIVMDQKAKQVR